MSVELPSIHPLSATSLLLELLAFKETIATATGFLITYNGSTYLVTNHHVFSGRHPDSRELLDKHAAIPTSVVVWHHEGGPSSGWNREPYDLLEDDGKPKYLEHPQNADAIRDVALLRLDPLPTSTVAYNLDFRKPNPGAYIGPSSPVSIVGFPMGKAAGGSLPVWKTGHIASEPKLDYGDLPSFLIDATTKQGMSGSPVAFVSHGGYPLEPQEGIVGGIGMGSALVFLGVYASRNMPPFEDMHIGRVWKPVVIDEILNAAG